MKEEKNQLDDLDMPSLDNEGDVARKEEVVEEVDCEADTEEMTQSHAMSSDDLSEYQNESELQDEPIASHEDLPGKRSGAGKMLMGAAIVVLAGTAVLAGTMRSKENLNSINGDLNKVDEVIEQSGDASELLIHRSGELAIKGLEPGATYVIEGVFVDEARDPVVDEIGRDVSFTTPFQANEDGFYVIPLSFDESSDFWEDENPLIVSLTRNDVLIVVGDIAFQSNMELDISIEASKVEDGEVKLQQKEPTNEASAHTHAYAPVYEMVETPAEGYWKTVVETAGYWEETPIMKTLTTYTCDDCGRDVTSAVNRGDKTPCGSNCSGAYTEHVEEVQAGVERIWHDEETKEVYVETKKASVEKVLAGHKCTDCGQWK